MTPEQKSLYFKIMRELGFDKNEARVMAVERSKVAKFKDITDAQLEEMTGDMFREDYSPDMLLDVKPG